MKLENVKKPRPGRDPWERLEGETARNFDWFCKYRDQGPLRSMSETARQLGHFNKSNKRDSTGNHLPNPTPVRRVAAKWKWDDRVTAFDQMMDKLKIAKAKAEAEKMVERHLSIAATVQSTAFKRLREMDEDELKQKMGPNTILKYLESGIDIERKTRGQPTVITKHDGAAAPSDADLDSEATAMAKDMLLRKITELAKRREQSEERAEPTNRIKDLIPSQN